MSTTTVRVILGLMTVGPEGTHGSRVTSLDEFGHSLDLFKQKGYNEIDTARLYCDGKQEEFTASARWKARGLEIATKWYPRRPGDHSPDTLRAMVAESLKQLKTDAVDLFYLHAPDRATPFAETLKAVNDLHQEGKFKRWGLSNFSAFEVAEIVTICNERGWVRPSTYQGVYNAFVRDIEAELIPSCRKYGLDVVIYNPLGGGILSGKYKSNELPLEGRFSESTGPLARLYRDRYFKSSKFAALAILEPVVEKHKLSLVEVALRWCVHHSALNIASHGNDGIILGFSSFKQLEGNLDAVSRGPLPDEVVRAIDEAWAVTKGESDPYWHGKLVYTYNAEKTSA